MEIRQLTSKDTETWKQIRFQALQEHPEAFGSSYEEESSWDDKIFHAKFENNDMFGAFENDQLISTTCFHQETSLKTQHRGFLWGMYTIESERSKGIGKKLMEHVIEHARSKVIQLHLTCVTTNEDAAIFYHKHGFAIYGTKPRSLLVEGEYYDEHLMVLDLTEEFASETTLH